MPPAIARTDAPAPRPPAPTPEENGVAAATDPCALRMQDLCGAMLLYFTANKHLPDKLESLQRYADAGTTLTFTCPASGQPYIYNSTGLVAPGIRDTLILYDATAAHRGERWGIVMAPPATGKAVLMYVIPLSDKLLNAYSPERTHAE